MSLTKILVGSRNAHKVSELKTLLKNTPIKVLSLEGFDLPDPEEIGETFIDNALLKAHFYAQATGLATLADDSGLKIEALQGAPGVRTRRLLDEKGGQEGFFSYLANLLQGQDPAATLHCALALVDPEGTQEVVEGVIEGTLVFPARGTGFGVDPIFQPVGMSKTFAEDPQTKNVLSHRAQALKALYEKCFR